jgi:hypothetical protein
LRSDRGPIELGCFVVLRVGVVVAALRVSELVAGEQHGRPVRQQEGGEQIALLSFAALEPESGGAAAAGAGAMGGGVNAAGGDGSFFAAQGTAPRAYRRAAQKPAGGRTTTDPSPHKRSRQ